MMPLPVRAAVAASLWLFGAAACTPFGIWVYEEPKVHVSGIEIVTDTLAPVNVIFDVKNPNHFDVTMVGVQLAFSLNGERAVDTLLGSAAVIAEMEQRSVRVSVSSRQMAPGFSWARIAPGEHRYTLRGQVELDTPIGRRRVRFEQEGVGRFGNVSLSALP